MHTPKWSRSSVTPIFKKGHYVSSLQLFNGDGVTQFTVSFVDEKNNLVAHFNDDFWENNSAGSRGLVNNVGYRMLLNSLLREIPVTYEYHPKKYGFTRISCATLFD